MSGSKTYATCVARLSDTEVVTSNNKGHVTLWDVSGTSPSKIKSIGTHGSKASFVTTHGDLQVFSAGYDGTVKMWQRPTASNNNFAMKLNFDEHLSSPGAGADTEVWVVAVSANGTEAISATNGGQVLHWDTSLGKIKGAEYKASDEPVGGLAFVPVAAPAIETQFLSCQGDGQMSRWAITNYAMPDLPFPHGNFFQVNSVAVTSKGDKAVTGSFDGRVRLWNVGTGALLQTYVPEHKYWVWRVALSPSNNKLASASGDGTVNVWDISGAMPIHQMTIIEPGGVMGVVFVSDTKLVYTTGPGSANEVEIRTV